jgi:mitochondrial fission protein ELM1
MKKVLILSDKKVGHFNQTLAISNALNQIEHTQTTTVTIKIKKVAKYLLRFLLNHAFGRALLKHKKSLSLMRFFYDIDRVINPSDIIISSGKDTSLLNAWLSLVYQSCSIYIGHPKKLDNRLFTAILTVLDLEFDNQIILDVAPTLPYSGDLDAFCKAHQLERNRRYYALLIGGDGSGYHYCEEEIDALISFVNRTASEIDWLVTTSRRTPVLFEQKMKQQMKTAMFVDYHTTPQKVVGAFLKLSEVVFVTEESASMVSEAVASQKPVVTLAPETQNPEKNYKKILKKFEDSLRIKRVKMRESENLEIDVQQLSVLSNDMYEELAKHLKSCLVYEKK